MTDLEDPTRRAFVADGGRAAIGAVAALAAPLVVPRPVLGRGHRAPSDKLNIAIVGCGGMGVQNALALAPHEHIGAVCDVDLAYSERCVAKRAAGPDGEPLRQQFAKATRHTDFRELLARENGVDAVVVATPDHLHASVALAAMDHGKHVYVQKPLAATVHEARVLRERTAAKPKLVTQMGNQGHSTEDARRINEWIAAGIIGPVREVHVWTNRPLVYWPQGLPRPGGIVAPPGPAQFDNPWTFARVQQVLAAALGDGGAPPAGLDWPLYLGPIAEDVPYHPIYHPFNWRGWLAFGSGALGDMGAHLIDHPFWALGLDRPSSIEATSTPWGTAAGGRAVSFPISTNVHFRFEARGAQPPVKLSWYDGGLYPPRPDALPAEVELASQGGVLYIGDDGVLLHDTYGANPRLYPDSLREAAAATPRTLPRIEGSHESNWVRAIRGEAQASSPMEYASRLTETMLLGLVALRAGPGRKILYDAERGAVVNLPSANDYLTRDYRAGWQIA